jgi:hypothetical protein
MPYILGLVLVILLMAFLASCSTGSLLRTSKAEAGAKGVPYSLPRSVLKLTLDVARVTQPRSGFNVSLSSEVLTVPDRSRSYLLQHRTSAAREDDVKIATTADGLLTTIVAHSDDKAIDMVKALAGGAAGVAQLFAGVPGEVRAAGFVGGGASEESVLGPLVGKHEIFVPLTSQATWSATDRAFVVVEDFTPFPSAPFTDQIRFKVLLMPAGMSADDSGHPPHLTVNEPSALPVDGVLVAARSPVLFRSVVEIGPAAGPFGFAFVQQLAAIPDYSPVVTLDYDRARFVKTTYSSKFDNGVLTSFDTNRPSSGLAIASAPLVIAKEILRVPAEILQLKFDISSKEKQLVESEAELAKSVAASNPDTAKELQDSAIKQNNLEAAYYAALEDVAVAQMAFNNAATNEKPQAKKAYIQAASAANNAAIAAGFPPPYNLAALP